MSERAIGIFIDTTHSIYVPLALVGGPLRGLYQRCSSSALGGVLRRVGNVSDVFAGLIAIKHVASRPQQLSLLRARLGACLNRAVRSVSSSMGRGGVGLR